MELFGLCRLATNNNEQHQTREYLYIQRYTARAVCETNTCTCLPVVSTYFGIVHCCQCMKAGCYRKSQISYHWYIILTMKVYLHAHINSISVITKQRILPAVTAFLQQKVQSFSNLVDKATCNSPDMSLQH
jgi:hypothetical protein